MPIKLDKMKKYAIDGLIAFEQKHRVWDLRFLGYPIWIHFRERLIDSGVPAERKLRMPPLRVIVKSFFQTAGFLFRQSRYKHVYFLMDRAELLEIYHTDPHTEKILFLNREQEDEYTGSDYISSDFLNLFRFLCRKSAYLLFPFRYKHFTRQFRILGYDTALYRTTKNAMGDALFLKLLSLLMKNNKKFYTGAVIPIGEKFLNLLNSHEVQHGVIHPSHVGYIGLPTVKNTLILYARKYETILRKYHYEGPLDVNTYKERFLNRASGRAYPVVIYTQPLQKMQRAIETFFTQCHPVNIYIQKHPRDYFPYAIDAKYFVKGTIPSEVRFPVFYTSSTIENFSMFDRTCYIYDVNEPGIRLEQILHVYRTGSGSQFIIDRDLHHLLTKITDGLK